MNLLRRKSLDFYFNVALILCCLIFSLLFLSSCGQVEAESAVIKKESSLKESSGCSSIATVKDYTGLDGCGKLLVLENGEALEPMVMCGTPPLSEPDDFVLNKMKDGMKVRISYEAIHNAASICMAGTVVSITCINEIKTND